MYPYTHLVQIHERKHTHVRIRIHIHIHFVVKERMRTGQKEIDWSTDPGRRGTVVIRTLRGV